MNEKSETMSDQLPDRLSIDPKSPYYNEEVLSRDVGIRFKGVEKTNVEEYCVSEGWVRGIETLLDYREILVLGERSIVVGIGSGQLLLRQPAGQFTFVERAIMVRIQLVKQRGCSLFCFREVDRAIAIRVKHSNPVRTAGLRQNRRPTDQQSTGGKSEN